MLVERPKHPVLFFLYRLLHGAGHHRLILEGTTAKLEVGLAVCGLCGLSRVHEPFVEVLGLAEAHHLLLKREVCFCDHGASAITGALGTGRFLAFLLFEFLLYFCDLLLLWNGQTPRSSLEWELELAGRLRRCDFRGWWRFMRAPTGFKVLTILVYHFLGLAYYRFDELAGQLGFSDLSRARSHLQGLTVGPLNYKALHFWSRRLLR